jgi:peptidyl-tRNA hydrolase
LARENYQVNYRLDKDVNDGVTKVVCGARNREKLEKAIEKAKELGMIEGVDACRTELSPRRGL